MSKWEKLLARIGALDKEMRFDELRIPKSLHRALAEHSKAEGISMNQYCLYLLTKNDATYHKPGA